MAGADVKDAQGQIRLSRDRPLEMQKGAESCLGSFPPRENLDFLRYAK